MNYNSSYHHEPIKQLGGTLDLPSPASARKPAAHACRGQASAPPNLAAQLSFAVKLSHAVFFQAGAFSVRDAPSRPSHALSSALPDGIPGLARHVTEFQPVLGCADDDSINRTLIGKHLIASV